MNDGYVVGEIATLTARFTNASGVLADPANVDLTITAPDGTITNVALGGLAHPSTGVYRYDLTLTQAGIWTYSFDADGSIEAENLGYLTVDALGSAVLRTGPAPWCSVEDVQALGAYSSLTDAQILRFIPVASALLYRRSGRQFSGILRSSVRPSRKPDGPYVGPGTWQPWDGSGWWPGWGTCACSSHRGACGQSVPEIALGYYPLRQIVSVTVDGAVVSPSAYRIDDHRYLVRTDGDGWPNCQDLTASLSEVGTFGVTLLHGVEPPPDGVLAAAALAGELAKANAGQPCQLPRRLTSLTRQGTTQVLVDPTAVVSQRQFGIAEVDLFLDAVNPGGIDRRATISSPWPRSTVRRSG